MGEIGAFVAWLGCGVVSLGCGYVVAKASARTRTSDLIGPDQVWVTAGASAKDGSAQ